MWRLAGAVPLWLAYSSVAFVLWILGVPLVFALSRCRAWTPQRSGVYADQRIVQAWRGGWLTWIWGNSEDGVTGALWYRQREYAKGKGDRTVALNWSAFRNPTNNLRFVPVVNPRIEPSRVRAITSYDPEEFANVEDAAKASGLYQYAFTWQGVFAGLALIVPARGEYFRVWWGWKLRPRDRLGVDPSDYRFPRCGFATQLKRV